MIQVLPSHFLQAISEEWIRVQGKARGGEKAQHTRVVCEHFEPSRNAAMGRQAHF
jgi:hypothetical protein